MENKQYGGMVVGGLGGLPGRADVQVAQAAPTVTISSRISLVISQAQELRERTLNVVVQLIGFESASEAASKPVEPTCLLDLFDMLSRSLQESLHEIERLQSRL